LALDRLIEVGSGAGPKVAANSRIQATGGNPEAHIGKGLSISIRKCVHIISHAEDLGHRLQSQNVPTILRSDQDTIHAAGVGEVLLSPLQVFHGL